MPSGFQAPWHLSCGLGAQHPNSPSRPFTGSPAACPGCLPALSTDSSHLASGPSIGLLSASPLILNFIIGLWNAQGPEAFPHHRFSVLSEGRPSFAIFIPWLLPSLSVLYLEILSLPEAESGRLGSFPWAPVMLRH